MNGTAEGAPAESGTVTAIYLRISSSLQAEANGTQSQEDAIRAWLDRNPREAVQWYSEDGARSARSTRGRSAYLRMLADIEAGRVREVLAFSLSRLSRSVADAAEYIRVTLESGVRTQFVSDGFTIDPASPFSKAMAQIAAVFAELDNEIRRSNTRAGIKAFRARGEKWGGQRLKVGAKGGRSLTDAQALEAARRKEAGETLAAIARDFGCCGRTLNRSIERAQGLSRDALNPGRAPEPAGQT